MLYTHFWKIYLIRNSNDQGNQRSRINEATKLEIKTAIEHNHKIVIRDDKTPVGQQSRRIPIYNQIFYIEAFPG